MTLIADGVLIATCLTTAIYCLVLSGRLKRLSSTEMGIGKQIKTLNATLEETRGALSELRATAGGASEQLNREIAAAERKAAQLSRLISRAGERLAAWPEETAPQTAAPARNGRPNGALGELFKQMSVRADETLAPPHAKEDPDPEELNADDALEAPLGEQQLGFLPETTDLPDDPEDLTLALGPEREAEVARIPADPPPAAGGARNDEGGVLKVERMAF